MSDQLAALDHTLWLSGRAARKLANVSPYRLMSLAATGSIRSLAPAGSAMRFHRDDCVKAGEAGAGVTEAAR